MDIAAETLQAFLDNAWDAATDAANSLRPQFRIYEKGLTNLFAGGVLGSVSKNSTSQSYRGPGVGSYTVAQLQTAWRMLINLYDEEKARTDYIYWVSKTYPTNQVGINFITKYPQYAADPDQAVYDFMVCQLLPVDNYQIDLTDLRLHPTLGQPFYPPGTW